jgi:high-affinity iron transporter
LVPTFVITLREGVEASLIIGIIAAFLVKEGRRDALGRMWVGVAIAVALCGAIAVALRIADDNLPQRQQEGLETVVGLVAAAMVTYMILWMRRHARQIKAELQGNAARALATGSAAALVAMAFLAVLREGFETAVFLLAVFQDTPNTASAGTGAVLGLLVAVVIGYLLYRGGVRINLARFFRATGLVLAVVAAGLVATAVHTAHEAGWFNGLQSQAVDLSWLVSPGSVRGSLLTGMLGLQPAPTVGEAAAWLLYAIPISLYIVWPDRWRPTRPQRATAAAATALLVIALVVIGCGSGGSSNGGGSGDAARHVKVTLTDEGCSPSALELPSGPTTFEVTNAGAAAVTEFEILKGSSIVGEVENVSEGLNRNFSLTLQPGTYKLACPNGNSAASGTLSVSGRSVTVADAAQTGAVANYRDFLEEQAEQLVVRTRTFASSVKAGDVSRAKDLYGPARVPYERIEPVAESFGSLDPAIDARAGDVPRSEWTGFHPIEQSLWLRASAGGQEGTAAKLLEDVLLLQRKVKQVKLEPAQIANGAVELLGEVSKSKVTGEEERYSHVDLLDFKANVDGAQAAFRAVAPIVSKSDPALAKLIRERFGLMHRGLAEYRKHGKFVSYTELTRHDKLELAQAVDALAEPLSRVPALVVK